MTRSLSQGPRASGPQLLGLLLTVPLALGLALHLPQAVASGARRLQPLALQPGHATPAAALALWLANVRTIALPIAAALLLHALRAHRPRPVRVRALLDVLLLAGVAANVLALVDAIAGYGVARLAPWLPHLPFEFAALASALAVYLAARRRPLQAADVTLGAGAALALLAIAAVLETYGAPHA